MPNLFKEKSRKGTTKSTQEAIKTELKDLEKHPKKFPGGRKQAIAVGYSIALSKDLGTKKPKKNVKKKM